MFLIIIDAHSKWMEVIPMKSAATLTTTQQLRMVFSRFGIPESIVSDNGPQFSSSEFEQFCRKNGIRHIRVSPYHLASNGLTERIVQTFKQGFQKHRGNNSRSNCMASIPLPYYFPFHNRDLFVAVTFRRYDRC